MTIDIVIPSKWRLEKLNRCLSSIFDSSNNTKAQVFLYLKFSEPHEHEHYKTILENLDFVKCELINSYSVPSFWNSHLNTMTSDLLMYINDDIILHPDTLEVINQEYLLHFPKLDGVMGLNQVNIPEEQAVEGAFGVIGRNYCKRFPNNQAWCPDYHRFWADYELWQYSKSINKFYFCRNAKLEHFHPAFGGTNDATHKDVRRYLSQDKATYRKRKDLGCLWGKNFTLVNEG